MGPPLVGHCSEGEGSTSHGLFPAGHRWLAPPPSIVHGIGNNCLIPHPHPRAATWQRRGTNSHPPEPRPRCHGNKGLAVSPRQFTHRRATGPPPQVAIGDMAYSHRGQLALGARQAGMYP